MDLIMDSIVVLGIIASVLDTVAGVTAGVTTEVDGLTIVLSGVDLVTGMDTADMLGILSAMGMVVLTDTTIISTTIITEVTDEE